MEGHVLETGTTTTPTRPVSPGCIHCHAPSGICTWVTMHCVEIPVTGVSVRRIHNGTLAIHAECFPTGAGPQSESKNVTDAAMMRVDAGMVISDYRPVTSTESPDAGFHWSGVDPKASDAPGTGDKRASVGQHQSPEV